MLRSTGFAVVVGLAIGIVGLTRVGLRASANDIVLYASDVTAVQGNWARTASASGAGGQKMASTDYGWSTPYTPLASPNDFFEATFTAPSATPYHLWLRLRAVSDSKWNDSVWVQFSDATQYQIGSTSALLVNLATDSTGCSVNGWGCQDEAYWLQQSATVTFTTAGAH